MNPEQMAAAIAAANRVLAWAAELDDYKIPRTRFEQDQVTIATTLLAAVPVVEAAGLVIDIMNSVERDDATWGDVAASERTGPRALGKLQAAVKELRGTK